MILPIGFIDAQLPNKSKKESKKAYNKAVENIQQKDYQSALIKLDICLEFDPELYNAYILKAKSYVELGETEYALATFSKP